MTEKAAIQVRLNMQFKLLYTKKRNVNEHF